MSLTKNDLAEISAIMKESISGVENRMDSIEGRLDKLEGRMDNVEGELKVIRVDILENNVVPRLNTIEQCYLDASKRYIKSADKFDNAIADIEVMKLAIQKNSEDIQELQLKQA